MSTQFIIIFEGCIAKTTEENTFLLAGSFLSDKKGSFVYDLWRYFGHIYLKSAHHIGRLYRRGAAVVVVVGIRHYVPLIISLHRILRDL